MGDPQAQLQRLHDVKEKWAYLSLEKKVELLTCIKNRCGDWGVTEQLAIAHVKARKMDPDASQHASSVASLVYVISCPRAIQNTWAQEKWAVK
jgi:hypothetical protein